MLKQISHPDIQHEIKENYQWYESKSQGLGEDFITELESAFRIITEIPDTWPVISKNFRRYLLNRFPFGVIYLRGMGGWATDRTTLLEREHQSFAKCAGGSIQLLQAGPVMRIFQPGCGRP
jgi:hypothetical protein